MGGFFICIKFMEVFHSHIWHLSLRRNMKLLIICATILGVLFLIGAYPIVGVVVTALVMALINAFFKE